MTARSATDYELLSSNRESTVSKVWSNCKSLLGMIKINIASNGIRRNSSSKMEF